MSFCLFSDAKQCRLTTAVERRLQDSFQTFSCDIGIEEKENENSKMFKQFVSLQSTSIAFNMINNDG